MDPLSIATGCASLISTIGGLTLSITSFVRSCREARSDLDRVSRELHSLQTVLELIQEDAKDDTKPFPEMIQRHVSGIVTNCNSVVVEVQTCITKYGDGKVRNKAAWVLNGQGDMEKLRSSLEAHKSALELALDMLTLSVTKDIKTDTTEILNDTAAIKDDTAQILEEIARLQERLPATAAAPNDYILQKFLEDMATYTESTLDVDGGFSDRASSKALSFIDEGNENPYVSNQTDLPTLSSKNEDNTEANENSHSESTAHGEAFEKIYNPEPPTELPSERLAKTRDHHMETTQASAKEILSRLNLNQRNPSFTFQKLQADAKFISKIAHTKTMPLHSRRPKSMDHVDAPERHERSISPPKAGKDAEIIVKTSRPSSATSSTGSYQRPDNPKEQETSARLKDLSPESVYRGAYGIQEFFDNYILILPVVEANLKAVPRTDDEEYTHTRFTFVTCPPYLMAGNRYRLRPTSHVLNPETKFILALEMNFLAVNHIKQTWNLIHDAVAYAESKLGRNTWRNVCVHIHFPKHTFKDKSAFLEKIGVIQNFNIPPQPILEKQVLSEALTQDTTEVAGRKVAGTMQEFTVQLRAAVGRTRADVVQADIPIQTVATRNIGNGYIYGHFSHWTKSIQIILDATHIIDMGYANDDNCGDYKFLYRAWVATKPFKVTTKDGIELVRFDDLVKQTRTLKERFLR